MKKVLILCTGNSCRSQMAEGFLKSFDPKLNVYSAGIRPADKISENAVRVMQEFGIDISSGIPEDVEKYLNESFDYVITVCDNARESCPAFSGKVKEQIHLGFEDPAEAEGTEEEIIAIFRKVRDEIQRDLYNFYTTKLK